MALKEFGFAAQMQPSPIIPMRLILILFALLTASTTRAQSAWTDTIWQPIGSAIFWDTTTLNKFNVRLQIGGATLNDGHLWSPCPAGVTCWYGLTDLDVGGQLVHINVPGMSVPFLDGNDCNFAQICIEDDPAQANQAMAVPTPVITIIQESSRAVPGTTPRSLELYGVNNPPRGVPTPFWVIYTECRRIYGWAGQTFCREAEAREYASVQVYKPYSMAGGATIVDLAGCGAGGISTGFPCGPVRVVGPNPSSFTVGDVWAPGSVLPDGINGTIPWQQAPYGYGIQWHGPGPQGGTDVLLAEIHGDQNGNIVLSPSGNIVSNSGAQFGDGSKVAFGNGRSAWVGGSSASNFIQIAVLGLTRLWADSGSVQVFNALFVANGGVMVPGNPVHGISVGYVCADASGKYFTQGVPCI